MRLVSCWMRVGSGRTAASALPILPNAVCVLVASTRAMPLPWTTSEPENTIGRLFASGRAHVLHRFRRGGLPTGTDSPVSSDSSTARFVARQTTRVRGNAVALGKHEEIADDDVAPGDAPLLAVADHERPRARQVAQRFQRAFALAFLSERDAR